MVVSEFARFAKKFDAGAPRLSLYLGLGHLRVTASARRIDWVGNKATRAGSFFQVGSPEGTSATFDLIVVAMGFGLESTVPEYPTASYWRNEQIGQPTLDGTRQTFLISGFGDGALTDLFRLTIERFRQDTILYELFDKRSELEEVERSFAAAWLDRGRHSENVLDLFELEDERLAGATKALAARIRKDTQVVLHVKGRNADPKSFSHVYGPHSSFLSRLLTFLLYRCGAFSISLGDLHDAVLRHRVPPENVLCRYGADTLGNLLGIFVDVDQSDKRLRQLKARQPQKARRFWEPGTFPIPG